MTENSQHDDPASGWTSLAPKYGPVERLTLPLAEKLIISVNDRLRLNIPNAQIFDNGCGTGGLISILKAMHQDILVVAADISAGMIDELRLRVDVQRWENVFPMVLDARKLEGIEDKSFTHTFSKFMICLAPDPELIAKEMYRVTKRGGVLGLATWGEPWFDYFSLPWETACKKLDPEFEDFMIMDPAWTLPHDVKKGIERAGFEDVVVVEKSRNWGFESADRLVAYFFEGNNPGNAKRLKSWEARGRSVEEVKPIFKKILEEEHTASDGTVGGIVKATLLTALKY